MKKLKLNKETIANLGKREMQEVKGLSGKTCNGETCPTFVVSCQICETEFVTVCFC